MGATVHDKSHPHASTAIRGLPPTASSLLTSACQPSCGRVVPRLALLLLVLAACLLTTCALRRWRRPPRCKLPRGQSLRSTQWLPPGAQLCQLSLQALRLRAVLGNDDNVLLHGVAQHSARGCGSWVAQCAA